MASQIQTELCISQDIEVWSWNIVLQLDKALVRLHLKWCIESWLPWLREGRRDASKREGGVALLIKDNTGK